MSLRLNFDSPHSPPRASASALPGQAAAPGVDEARGASMEHQDVHSMGEQSCMISIAHCLVYHNFCFGGKCVCARPISSVSFPLGH
jgi:hypothetical protein